MTLQLYSTGLEALEIVLLILLRPPIMFQQNLRQHGASLSPPQLAVFADQWSIRNNLHGDSCLVHSGESEVNTVVSGDVSTSH